MIKCEREIGSPTSGWHSCGKKAHVKSERRMITSKESYYYNLYYCSNHAKFASISESASIIIDKVESNV